MRKEIQDFLLTFQDRMVFQEPLSKHTWFGVGGPADAFFVPSDIQDLKCFLETKPKDLPYYILGGGSNLLVRDGGIRGVVIKLNSPYFQQILPQKDSLKCFGGCPNARLKKILIEHERSGLEFLCSIPGTIGGSVRSNAGCFGSCISDVLISADIMDNQGNIKTVGNDWFDFAYRFSDFHQDCFVLSAVLKTSDGSAQTIQNTINEQALYRKIHQPTGVKTAGSTFKNPPSLSAWKLIEQAGCKDFRFGDAKVSDKHCNFLVNTGNATAEDIENLGNAIRNTVQEKTGIQLQWEIQITGQKK